MVKTPINSYLMLGLVVSCEDMQREGVYRMPHLPRWNMLTLLLSCFVVLALCLSSD